MTKYLVGIILACFFLIYTQTQVISKIKDQRKLYEKKSIMLEESIARYNEKQVEASSTITEIRERVKYIKTDCDCYNSRIDDRILNLVQGDKSRAY